MWRLGVGEFMVGVGGRFGLLEWVGMAWRSGLVGVGVDELWSDEGAMGR